MTGQAGIQGRSRQAPRAPPARHHRRDAGVGADPLRPRRHRSCSSSTAPTSRTTATPGGRSRPPGSRRPTRSWCAWPSPRAPSPAEQYLELERLADEHANGTLRVTTRQGFQFHGVLKGDLKPTIAGINQALLTTISACGDVQRNVMGCSAPLGDADHAAVRAGGRGDGAPSCGPATHAYHEIWLDGEKQVSTEQEEPFYRDRYLPRKFKTAVGLSTDNCVDIWSQDVGLLAIVRDGRIHGLQPAGGRRARHDPQQGRHHRPPGRAARLRADRSTASRPCGIVAAIFRDHGNRSDRRHARLKYLLAEWGIAALPRGVPAARVVHARARRSALPPLPFHDHLGRHRQRDGRWFYGVFIQSGRIVDTEGHRLKTALHEIVTRLRPGIRLTAQQNLLLTDLDADGIETVERILQAHGVTPADPALGRAAVLDGLPGAADLRPGGGRVGARHPGDPRPVRGRARRASACATRRSPSG